MEALVEIKIPELPTAWILVACHASSITFKQNQPEPIDESYCSTRRGGDVADSVLTLKGRHIKDKHDKYKDSVATRLAMKGKREENRPAIVM